MFEPLDPVKLRGVASMLALELNQRLRDRNINMVSTQTSSTNSYRRLMAMTMRHLGLLSAEHVQTPSSCMLVHAPQALHTYLGGCLVPPGGCLPVGTGPCSTSASTPS